MFLGGNWSRPSGGLHQAAQGNRQKGEGGKAAKYEAGRQAYMAKFNRFDRSYSDMHF